MSRILTLNAMVLMILKIWNIMVCITFKTYEVFIEDVEEMQLGK